MNPQLDIRNAGKKFKNKVALYPLSLIAESGECIVLCGGNGAGKSTLLNLIAGISRTSEGTVIINNIDIHKNRKKYVSMIGYMPDEFFAQEALTVMEFLQFYAAFHNVSLNRVKEIIGILGLEEKRQDMIKHLSKGMRQRLLFGQAWISNPAVMILDEPTNGLDPYWIDQFIGLLKEIKNNGTTIIFSTHMMDVAAEVADKVLYMENGRLVKVIMNHHQDHKKFMVELLKLYRKQDW